jgi:hypothetical protein
VKLQSNNTSGHSGVTWSKYHRKWRVNLRIAKKDKFFGYFRQLEDAVDARNAAVEEYRDQIQMSNNEWSLKCKKYFSEEDRKAAAKEYSQLWHKNNQKHSYYIGLKASAVRKGVKFTLPPEIVDTITSCCENCGKKMNIARGTGVRGVQDNSVSCDRLVPDGDYEPDNIWWICGRCNRIKSNATIDELTKLVANIRAKQSVLHIKKIAA